MKNNIWHDKRLSDRIKTATIVLLFLISVSTLTSTVHAQSNPALSVQSQKVSSRDPSSSSSNAVGSNESFYLYTGEIEGINETKLGMPADYYIPSIFVANKGDSITMHFYNLDGDDRHTFTIGAPYNINQDVSPMHNATFTFKAGHEGLYRFYCTYHQPTMTGELIVLPPSTELTAAATDGK